MLLSSTWYSRDLLGLEPTETRVSLKLKFLSGYGHCKNTDCSLIDAMEVVGGKRPGTIIRCLGRGPCRFNELRREEGTQEGREFH